MTREETLQLAKQEFAVAKQATVAGNHGMTRVCARRQRGRRSPTGFRPTIDRNGEPKR
jgi:hypothetical protein